jgi:hypothetical protein
MLSRGNAPIGVIVNGVDANNARIIEGYLQQMWAGWLAKFSAEQGLPLKIPVLGKIYLGIKALISTDSYLGRVFRGWIGYISPTAEFTPKNVETPDLRTRLVYQVRVLCVQPAKRVATGDASYGNRGAQSANPQREPGRRSWMQRGESCRRAARTPLTPRCNSNRLARASIPEAAASGLSIT